jgi:hypothetical protein
MIFVVLAVIAAIGALAGWIIVSRIPRGSGRSHFDRIFLGTIAVFGTILALTVVWFIAGCIVRTPGIPPLCT